MGRYLIDAMLLPFDVHRIRSTYQERFGRPPRLLRPRTFNEKLQRAKLLHRRKRHLRYADKLAVRDYVRECLGESALIPLLWKGQDLREAASLNLEEPFIIKDNHGTGAHIMAKDPAHFDWEAAIEESRGWLSRRYDAFSAEWQYRWIEPCFLIERFLTVPDAPSLRDYKFFCFHGRVHYFQVDLNRATNHTRALFDRNGRRLPVALHYPAYEGTVELPSCLESMIEWAELLSAKEPFIRVDLYDVNGPLFGELTLHPGAGLEQFEPSHWDREFGRPW